MLGLHATTACMLSFRNAVLCAICVDTGKNQITSHFRVDSVNLWECLLMPLMSYWNRCMFAETVS